MQRVTKKWDADRYDAGHSFVWKHGEDLVDLLDPQSGEVILDLGCGTGHLTSAIEQRGARVVGLDRSEAMVCKARDGYPDIDWVIGDGQNFYFACEFNAVFSNAAIHWMRDQGAVLRCIRRALRPLGRFVAEFGGKGNLDGIRAAVAAAMIEVGAAPSEESYARYYPTIGEYATLLEANGFHVTHALHFERPTPLEGGENGLRRWLENFADSMLEAVPMEKRQAVIAGIENQLRPALFYEETWYADYRRIQVRAIRM